MSTLRVTAEPLTVHPHPNADRLELAQVGLYRAVVAKGAYRTGEHALYVPEQAVLPDALIEELGLVGRLAGSAANRVKAVRLRGELSQGLVCRPAALGRADWAAAHAAGTDFADALGIVKWVPPIPARMSGDVESGAELLSWVDIENLHRFPDVFSPGEPVVATEKVHGTCLAVTHVAGSGRLLVSSKGLAASGLALKESQRNVYWRAVRRYDLAEVLADLCAQLGAARVALYGEVYGRGLQDLHYGVDGRAADGPGFVAFDLRVDVSGTPEWVDAPRALELVAAHGVPTVPVLHDGPFDVAAVLAAAEGDTVVGGGAHLREGVVVRPRTERWSPLLGDRAIAKAISPAYLTRGGAGTEYE